MYKVLRCFRLPCNGKAHKGKHFLEIADTLFFKELARALKLLAQLFFLSPLLWGFDFGPWFRGGRLFP
jgi:hypothetical protein